MGRRPFPSAPLKPLMLVVGLGALVSFSLAGVALQDGFHPMALVASLLPLQMAALLWGLSRR